MSAARSALLFAVLPLFAACQSLGIGGDDDTGKVSTANQVRMQGELTGQAGQLVFQPCNEQRRYVVSDAGNTSILQESAPLADSKGRVFADVRGSLGATKTQGMDGTLNLTQFYRLERVGNACSDPNFRRTTIHASGSGPKWTLAASAKGMVLEREGQPDFAVPYMEEQLPDGRFNLSTEANDQRVELWVAPQRCVDPTDGSVQQLSAELRVNGEVRHGCAYFGGARN